MPLTGELSWTVIGEDHLPIPPVEAYLAHLSDLNRSPNTVRTYAHGLKEYFTFLAAKGRAWEEVRLEDLGEFASWLRRPAPNVVAVVDEAARRGNRTVSLILAAVGSFYDFHARNGCEVAERLTTWRNISRRRYKPFLHHVSKGRPARARMLKIKTAKPRPQTLTPSQVQSILDACDRLRDRFLLALLYETGMRIGQALGLRHEDMHTWDNRIWIVPRDDNANGARSKSTHAPFPVDVSGPLVSLYGDYMIREYGELDSDYVFVNLWREPRGAPMRYSSVAELVGRISKRTGIAFTAHAFRHTHATELLRAGIRMEIVAKRLGHASVQTTIDTYAHIGAEDLRGELDSYWRRRDSGQVSVGVSR